MGEGFLLAWYASGVGVSGLGFPPRYRIWGNDAGSIQKGAESAW